MNNHFKKISVGILFIMLNFNLNVFALGYDQVPADQEEVVKGGKKVYGVTYNIAKDRNVVKIGSLVEPEGLDKYISRHFDDIKEQIAELQTTLKALEREVKAINRGQQAPKSSILTN